MRDHTKLRAFELADMVALETYRITQNFPREEEFGLTSQMRKACVSVPSNIVEGCARNTTKNFLRFLDISFGSLRELHYQFSLASRLNYVKNPTEVYESLLNEIEKGTRLINKIHEKIRTKLSSKLQTAKLLNC